MGRLFNFLTDEVPYQIGKVPGDIINGLQVTRANFHVGNQSEDDISAAIEGLKKKGLYTEPKKFGEKSSTSNSSTKEEESSSGAKTSKEEKSSSGAKTSKEEKSSSGANNGKKNESPFNNGGLFVREENGKLIYTMLHELIDSVDPLFMEAKMCDMTLLAMIRDSDIGPKYIGSDEYKDWLRVKELIDSRSKKTAADSADAEESVDTETAKAESEAPTEEAGAEKVEEECESEEKKEKSSSKVHFTSKEPPKPPKEEEVMGNSGDSSNESTVDNTKDKKGGTKDLKGMSKEDIKKSMMNSARNSIKRDDGESNIYKETANADK